MRNDFIREQICTEIVGMLIRERKKQGISGNKLAEKAGLSQALISTLETKPWNPTIETLLRIAEVLDVDLGKIISKAKERALKKQRK